MKVVISGGHHTSALPVIKKLRELDKDVEIFWFGHKFSLKGSKSPTLEFREINDLGIPFYDLKAGKFYKTFNIKRLLKIPYGYFQALYLLARIRPDVILSFGGYLAVPTVLAGSTIGIPSVTHEQTVVVGWANIVVSKFAEKVLISWPSSKKYFPLKKVIVSGLPLREEIFRPSSSDFTFDNSLPVIYVTGGKTGAHIINKVVLENLEMLLNKFNIIHQTGDNTVFNDFEKLEKRYSEIKNNVKGVYYPKKFIFSENIGEVFSKSNVVVSRSGAHTTYELIALKKKSLLIPIPWVSHNEQNKNAAVVKDLGLAQVLSEKELTGETLYECIVEVLNQSLPELSQKELSQFEFKDSAEIIANEVIKSCPKKKKS